MEKRLYFKCRGEWFVVKQNGDMSQENRANNNDFSGEWQLLGVSTHHWQNHIHYQLSELFDNPGNMIYGLVWDLDHGTVRKWAGQYYNKLPRVTMAYIK